MNMEIDLEMEMEMDLEMEMNKAFFLGGGGKVHLEHQPTKMMRHGTTNKYSMLVRSNQLAKTLHVIHTYTLQPCMPASQSVWPHMLQQHSSVQLFGPMSMACFC